MDPLIPWAGRSRIRPPRFVHVFLWTELGRWIAPSVIIAGTISLYMATCDGPLLGPDSLVYLSTAESLSATGRAESYFVEPLLHWPPAYPALLAVASVGPFPATVVASLVGAIVFAATGFVLLFHATRAEKGFAGSIMSMLYATSQPMVYVSSYVGSEGLFILACTVVVVGADMYRRTDDWRWLAAGTAAAAIAPLVRYLGVAAIAAGVGILLLPSARQAWARRMSAAVAFAVVSMAPLGLWLLRNLSVSGSLTGPRGDSTLSLSGALGCLGRTLAEWLAYPVSRGYPNTAVAAAVAAVLALAAFHLQSRRRGPDGTGGLVAPYAIFGLAYVGALLWAETRVSVDFPSDRLLSPVAPLMIVWLAVTADRLLTSDQRRAGAGGAWRLALGGDSRSRIRGRLLARGRPPSPRRDTSERSGDGRLPLFPAGPSGDPRWSVGSPCLQQRSWSYLVAAPSPGAVWVGQEVSPCAHVA